jgi:thiol-disulfide isomerase/thioredoxin
VTRSNKRRVLLFAAVAVFAGAAGMLFNVWRMSGGRDAGVADVVMATRLADLGGQSQPLSQWRGKVLVVNLWATWCEPCREEIPAFVRLQDKYRARGLQFVGIAIDRRDPVQAFVREFGMNYPVLLGGIETVEMSRRVGNRVGALPFTIIIDRNGKIAGTELGGIKEAKLQGIIESLL